MFCAAVGALDGVTTPLWHIENSESVDCDRGVQGEQCPANGDDQNARVKPESPADADEDGHRKQDRGPDHQGVDWHREGVFPLGTKIHADRPAERKIKCA